MYGVHLYQTKMDHRKKYQRKIIFLLRKWKYNYSNKFEQTARSRNFFCISIILRRQKLFLYIDYTTDWKFSNKLTHLQFSAFATKKQQFRFCTSTISCLKRNYDATIPVTKNGIIKSVVFALKHSKEIYRNRSIRR